jgi:HK97 family phage portal protein
MKISLRTRLRNGIAAFRKAMAQPKPTQGGDLRPVSGGFLTLANAVGDFFTGAWQQVSGPVDEEDVAEGLTVAVVYDCVRRISTDIAKMSPGVRRLADSGVWVRATHQVFSKLIYRPNHFQTWFQFIVCWVCSRLIAGNTYVVKLYRGQVIEELVVLDPTKCQPLVASDTGRVFYRLSQEPLARIAEDMIVSAEDIIHDRYLPLGHPLIGTAPMERALTAARARQGILTNAANLNANASVPPGILTTPEGLTETQLDALAEKWRKLPKGRIAVLDASFKFEALAAKYVDSQSQEIAEMSGTDVCIAFGMPPWKLGIGARPVGTPEALQVIYYQDCLQWQVEEIEQCLDHGLRIPANVYVELDPTTLLRMDSKTKADVVKLLTGCGVMAPNEGRAWFDYEPVEGGGTPYLQQQNYSLAALAKRDALAPPAVAGGSPSPSADDGEEEPEANPEAEDADANAELPALPWRGVYDAAREYPKDSLVTHRRGLWLARDGAAAGAKPGTSGSGWRLIAGHSKPIPGAQE